MAAFDVDTKSYIALMPHVGDKDEVVIYRYIELEGDEIEISGIEDDEEFERALDKFDSLIEDVEDEEVGDYF